MFTAGNGDRNFKSKVFWTPPSTWNSKRPSPTIPGSERKRLSPHCKGHLFHVLHKVPSGDSPYVRAKHVQLIDKDPSRAISLFWSAINSGDRVDSALKDMAIVMKQLDRSDEAIEAIKSFRYLCPPESQESLDNVLVELYKRSGRIDEQIEMLQCKVKQVEDCIALGGKRTKMARSQGKKIQITIEQEYNRLLGNLAWAYMQQNDFKCAEELYRKALSLEPDKNKKCNLAICLMHMNRITEAKSLLETVRSLSEKGEMEESFAKAYERAVEMVNAVESESIREPVSSVIDRYSSPHMFADKLNTTPYEESPCRNGSRFGGKRNKCWMASGDSTWKNAYASPSPARKIPKVLYTQPKRSSLALDDGDHGRAFIGKENASGNCNRKLLFGLSENVQVMENQKFSIHSKKMSTAALQIDNNHSTFICDDELLRSSGAGREVTKSSFLQPVTDTENCNFWVGEMPSMVSNKRLDLAPESQMGIKNKIAIEKEAQCVFGDIGSTQNSSVCERKTSWDDMAEDDEFRESIPFATPGKRIFDWSNEDFYDENSDSNIVSEILTPLDQVDSLSQKMELFNLKDGYRTQPSIAASSMNKTTRRSLRFDQNEKLDTEEKSNALPLPRKILNFESSVSGAEDITKLKRRNRLQVFSDITRLQESPKPIN